MSCRVVSHQSLWLRVLPGGARLVQPRWMPERRIPGGGQTGGVSFWPFPNSSGWRWLLSSVFPTRTSCCKTTHMNGSYGARPGWAVSVSALPLTGWASKNWCFPAVVLGKTLESPLDNKEIQPVHPKGNQPWIFIGRTDAEAEAPVLWPPDVKNWLIWKDPDAGKDWRWEEKGMTEDEMVGWHHWIDGHESEQTLEDNEGQGSLACCSPWGLKESDKTWLNRKNNKIKI